jgi:hypothetical protein
MERDKSQQKAVRKEHDASSRRCCRDRRIGLTSIKINNGTHRGTGIARKPR